VSVEGPPGDESCALWRQLRRGNARLGTIQMLLALRLASMSRRRHRYTDPFSIRRNLRLRNAVQLDHVVKRDRMLFLAHTPPMPLRTSAHATATCKHDAIHPFFSLHFKDRLTLHVEFRIIHDSFPIPIRDSLLVGPGGIAVLYPTTIIKPFGMDPPRPAGPNYGRLSRIGIGNES